MPPKAKYDLSEVFRLIAKKKYWFSAKPRATYAVIAVYATTLYPKSEVEAETFILEAIGTLEEQDFCERVLQWNDPKCIADVYGLIYDGRPWYVKFRIEDGLLEEISFHPPEKQMKTVGDRIIPAGGGS